MPDSDLPLTPDNREDVPPSLPPPPGSQDPVTPEKKRKKRDWWNIGVAVVFGAVLLGAVSYGVVAWHTEPAKDYSTASATPDSGMSDTQTVAPSQATLDAMTVTIVQALEADDEKLLEGTVRDIQAQTGCLAVAGGRVIVDPKDKAEVAEEASKRAQYEATLEAQGLHVGHYEFRTPEGLVHQVIGFECS